MSTISVYYAVLVVLCVYFISINIAVVDANPPTTKEPVSADKRPGRCPHPQYTPSQLPCTTDGNRTICPNDLKCCPTITGMKCSLPCPEWSSPCTINCPFGLKVVSSPCSPCECALNPCLSKTCASDEKCVVEHYEPCPIKDKCGLTAQCVKKLSNQVTSAPVPKVCPDYWPSMANGNYGRPTCNGSDDSCPKNQKCCQGPRSPFNFDPSQTPLNYCTDPCDDISTCTLKCPLGLQVHGACRICQCNIDPCITTICPFRPSGQPCRPISAPCHIYAGSPPCPLIPSCLLP